MTVIPEKKMSLWSSYGARFFFVDKIFQTLSQIQGLHIPNCINGHNI